MLAALLSFGLGVAYLQSLLRVRRWRPRGAALVARDNVATRRPASTGSVMSWPSALLLLPLWCGPAQRTRWALLTGAAAMLLPVIGLLALHAAEPWWLALATLLALLVATRVNQLARLELADLFQACTSLPLRPERLQLARASIGLWPVLPGLALLCASALYVAAPTLRPAVLWAWALLCLGICTVEVLSEPAQASNKAVRWLFSLILCVCLATEVLA